MKKTRMMIGLSFAFILFFAIGSPVVAWGRAALDSFRFP